MKCACGNEQHRPLVSPRPHSFVVSIKGKRETIHLNFAGGFIGAECWFCWSNKERPAHPR